MIIIEIDDGFVFLKNIRPEQAVEILASFDSRDLRNIGGGSRYGGAGNCRSGGSPGGSSAGGGSTGGAADPGTIGMYAAANFSTIKICGSEPGTSRMRTGTGTTGMCGAETGASGTHGGEGEDNKDWYMAGTIKMLHNTAESPDSFICGIFVPARWTEAGYAGDGYAGTIYSGGKYPEGRHTGSGYPEGRHAGGVYPKGLYSGGRYLGSVYPGAVIPNEITKISGSCTEPEKPALKPAGLISGTLYGSILWIRMLAVVPRFRRKGIGGRASGLLFKYCRDKCGISCAALSVAGENRAGVCFWLNQGFAEAGRLYKPLYGDEQPHAVVIMKKDLHT